MARRDAAGVRFFTRKGHDFAGRFPMAAAAVATLPARSCLIDGEAIVTDRNGLAVFDLIRGRQPSAAAVLCAFDLLELDGEDLRREPNRNPQEHPEVAAARQACGHRVQWRDRLPSGLRARLRGHRVEAPGSPYRSGRADRWIKGQVPGCARSHREAEEDWNK